MKLGNRAKISLPTRQNGVENRDKVYLKQSNPYLRFQKRTSFCFFSDPQAN